MREPVVVSIIPYKILPARIGGEKGIALFNEYLGQLLQLTGIGTKNNDISQARHYKMYNILSNKRTRYANIFLYFTIRKIIKREKATHLITEHPYYGWLAYLLKKTLPVTWIVHSHNIEFVRSRSIGRWWWKALKWYEAWVYHKADINFFISEDDLSFAVNTLKISPEKSHTITYGIETHALPADIGQCRRNIRQQYHIGDHESILLFNGALYHHSNYDALQVILDKINPVLLEHAGLSYKIIVCGKGLPDFFNNLEAYRNKNIIYAGFVDDVSLYFKAADIFLNPILSGGGVKTKAIEAIAANCTVVSTVNGAIGLKKEVCGTKLYVVQNGDWENFAATVINCLQMPATDTPPVFFDYYYWGNITRKAYSILKAPHAQSD